LSPLAGVGWAVAVDGVAAGNPVSFS
jgi:hypothetical protein